MFEEIIAEFKPEIERIVGQCSVTIAQGHDGRYCGSVTTAVGLNRTLAMFELTSAPGLPDVMVSCHFYVAVAHRGQGLGKLLNRMKLEIAKATGCKAIIATINKMNVAEKRILIKNHWQRAFEFKGHNNTIEIWAKDLN